MTKFVKIGSEIKAFAFTHNRVLVYENKNSKKLELMINEIFLMDQTKHVLNILTRQFTYIKLVASVVPKI